MGSFVEDSDLKILHRYILKLTLRNLGIALAVLCSLFIAFDFFDRIDNLLGAGASFGIIVIYFVYKIPLTISLMLPVATLLATIFTIGLLSKNSEVTAMRASGVTVLYIARPVLIVAALLSLFAIILNETIVPHTQYRVREIYNIDIRKKDKSGTYSQRNFWWRNQDRFFSVKNFDSRDSTLNELSIFEVDNTFNTLSRTDSPKASWIDPLFGWSMEQVTEYDFPKDAAFVTKSSAALPLVIDESPRDFYRAKTDPHTMSFTELREFIDKQQENGLSVASYMADLHNKFAFPMVIFLVAFIALPFSLQPARSGSMAFSIIAGVTVSFLYYAVHSFSIAMGRAEIWPAFLAAWMANIVIGVVALFLNLGAEAPR